MSIKRIIPCLDIKDGRVVKGVNFQGLRDIGPPVERGRLYSESGADELVLYDIAASVEGRRIFADVVRQVADGIAVPLTVAGGVRTIEDFGAIMDCGADKVSINTGALENPALIEEAARKFGSPRVVLALDVKRVADRFHVFTKGGMEDTGLDAMEWIRRGESLGAGELVLNSIDADGVKAGYDLELLAAACDAVDMPIVASGGAGCIDDFIRLFKAVPKVSAGLAASVFHFGTIEIPELKRALAKNGIPVSA